jgi:hypothetical protein
MNVLGIYSRSRRSQTTAKPAASDTDRITAMPTSIPGPCALRADPQFGQSSADRNPRSVGGRVCRQKLLAAPQLGQYIHRIATSPPISPPSIGDPVGPAFGDTLCIEDGAPRSYCKSSKHSLYLVRDRHAQ